MMNSIAQELRNRLRGARSSDGGLGPRPNTPSEPEPTALLAIALDDDGARSWLVRHQSADGSFVTAQGEVANDSPTPLGALALLPSESRERALDYLVAARAPKLHTTSDVPIDPSVRGWAWTRHTSGWVEPTARAILALRILRPAAHDALADGLALLRDRECLGGGWNYGNRSVFGALLDPYAETTAVALIALNGLDEALAARGLAALRRTWPDEPGGLSLALALAAFRLAGDHDAAAVREALTRTYRRTEFLGDMVALAWAAIASGDGLHLLRGTG